MYQLAQRLIFEQLRQDQSVLSFFISRYAFVPLGEGGGEKKKIENTAALS